MKMACERWDRSGRYCIEGKDCTCAPAPRTAPAVPTRPQGHAEPTSDTRGVNALHEACARAIADALDALVLDISVLDVDAAAVAAVGVCLAEAQRAIEASKPAVSAALRKHNQTGLNVHDWESDCCAREALGVVLAVLAALAEDAA